MIHKQLFSTILFFALVYSIGYSQKRNNTLDAIQGLNDRVLVQNLTELNTPFIEFSPSYYREGIVFVTARQRGGFYDPKLGSTYFELFYAKLNENGTPYKPKPFSLEINTKYHEGPVSFTSDANHMFFSRNNIQDGGLSKSKDGVGKVQLFEAQRGIFDWEGIRPLPFNSPEFNSMHPSVNAEGTKLYFSSNRTGGFGGMDIYVAEKIEGKWTEPINLGPDVNTTGNEVFPFMHSTGVLFFASDGHQGYGGLDLFLIDISRRKWGQIINMGSPFNSTEDDFGFTMNGTGTQGFFSSNREKGLGKDDIYIFNAPDGIEGIKVAKQVIARVEVRDKETKSSLAGAKIRVFEKAADGSTKNGDLYEVEIQPNGNGFSLVEKRKTEAVLGAPQAVIGKDGYAILTLDPKQQYILFIDRQGYRNVEMDLTLNPTEAYYPIEVLMEKMNCIPLEGTIKSKGYNRRIPNASVKLVSSCGDQVIVVNSDVEGNFKHCLEFNCRYLITATKLGFEDDTKELSTINLRGSRSFSLDYQLSSVKNVVEVPRNLLNEGTTIFLESIAYDFNKSAIRKGAARDLEALASLMQEYSSLKVELAAHTDSRGTDEYNKSLSETRALYAKDFLIEKGINARRIQTKGMGESQLRNECVDGTSCTEAQHSYNRRIEVRILSVREDIDLDAFNAALKSK
jgi:outer membrane protein OmpA-like peptidoglycan-associated protein